MNKCIDKDTHDFIPDEKESYTGKEMMTREVRCIDCNRRALEYYMLIDTIETVDMYGEILD